jgi:hypothetical protein
MSTAMDLVNGECRGESSLLGEANIAASMKKTRANKCVYGRKGTEDATIKVSQPEQSSWYQMHVVNYCLLEEDLSLALNFRTSFFKLVANISTYDIFD